MRQIVKPPWELMCYNYPRKLWKLLLNMLLIQVTILFLFHKNLIHNSFSLSILFINKKCSLQNRKLWIIFLNTSKWLMITMPWKVITPKLNYTDLLFDVICLFKRILWLCKTSLLLNLALQLSVKCICREIYRSILSYVSLLVIDNI